MGLDIESGLIFGSGFSDEVAKWANKTVGVTRYNETTGRPYVRNEYERVLIFQKDFWEYKKNQEVRVIDILDDLREMQARYEEEKQEKPEGTVPEFVFSESLDYFGFAVGELIYTRDDVCIPAEPDFSKAEAMWNSTFPTIHGKLLLFTRFSY